MQTTIDMPKPSDQPGSEPFAFSFDQEFSAAEFGDQRLTKRAVRFANSALRRPETSIPTMAGGPSGAEGLYRFIANDKVTPENVAKPHSDQTLARCRASGTVLVLHDTTTFGYGKLTKRQGLGDIGGGGLGFLAHVSLCVQEDSRLPLGVLQHQTFVRPPASPDRKRSSSRNDRKDQTDQDNEAHRWYQQALETGKSLAEVPHVHVADREADDYKFLSSLDEAGEDFVTRVSTNRKLDEDQELFAEMDGLIVQICRKVTLSRRAPAPGANQRKANPPREERTAKLEISAGRLRIPRSKRAPKTAPRAVDLNFVLVREIDVPDEVEPVVWRLVTNLPVSTPEEVARVVDIYRARWVIEEFFKALKTGCSFNDHQLESYGALTKLLSLLLPVAWKLLEIRTVVRQRPEAPATVVLTAQQVAMLRVLHDRQHPKSKLATKPNVREVAFALARLGGHFKQNGEPGWQTLGAGLQRLLQAEQDVMALIAQMPHVQAPAARH